MNVWQRMVKMVAPGTLYRNLPFVYFLALLGVIYIAFGHYAERNMRKIDSLQDQLQEQRWHYMSVHSEMMREGSRSEVSDVVSESGLRTPRVAPHEIIVEGKSVKEGHE